MKRPEDIPDDIVTRFAKALGSEYSDTAVCQHTAEDVRKALALVWDDIWGAGFQNGLQTKIEQS